MRIALISYEFPPDTALGGIGTYTWQAATLLSQRGHVVEVFAASAKRSGHFEEGNVGVNLVGEMRREKFAEAVAPVFSERHAICGFNIVESPEYSADGHEIRKAYPDLPHVVKLHTPTELQVLIGRSLPLSSEWLRHNYFQVRMALGALRRLQRPRYEAHLPPLPDLSDVYQVERNTALNCDLVVSPSQALADWAIREWSITPSRMMVVPNPYVPPKRLLSIPVGGKGNVVGYFGRLEQRKGVADLIDAIPRILRMQPETRFRFVGKSLIYPGTLEPFDVYLMRRLRRFRKAIEIVGSCPLDQMPEQYASVDVCIFPSIWENFPNVCLEAMAAGRAIVASNAGGMAEMLEGGVHGILVPPREPKAIAEGVVRMLRSPSVRQELGTSARKRVLDAYGVEKIGPQLEQSYETAVALCHENKS